MTDSSSDPLLAGYRRFRAHQWPRARAAYETLAEAGQTPHTLFLACSDSRADPALIFDAAPGDLFVVRNVANLVPLYQPDGGQHGTSAAVEYAVTALKVAHLIVLGHSSCGGVAGCMAMCSGHAPELLEKSSFVGRWMDILKPGYEKVKDEPDPETRQRMLEKEAVLTSLNNLMEFPFVREAVEAQSLSLHGLWTEIGAGALEYYDPAKGGFYPV